MSFQFSSFLFLAACLFGRLIDALIEDIQIENHSEGDDDRLNVSIEECLIFGFGFYGYKSSSLFFQF